MVRLQPPRLRRSVSLSLDVAPYRLPMEDEDDEDSEQEDEGETELARIEAEVAADVRRELELAHVEQGDGAVG